MSSQARTESGTRHELAQLARAMAADVARWRTAVDHLPHRRNCARLSIADDHEVWLICWDLGQTALLHDHGDSAGAFIVVDGALLEDFARLGARRLSQRRVSRGAVRTFGPGYVHNLVNAGPGLATSIHAYSPRLTTMTYYAVLSDGVVPVRAMAVDAPEPAHQ